MLYKDKLLGPDVQLIHTYSARRKSGHDRRNQESRKYRAVHASRLASACRISGISLSRRAVQPLSRHDHGRRQRRHFSIMRLMLQLNHLRSMDVMEVQPRRILELATLDGAKDSASRPRRLAHAGQARRFDSGANNDLNVAPFGNPALLLVQQAQPYNVDTVVIDGLILKHKGELVAIDADEVIRKAAELFAAARKRAGGRISTRSSSQ